MSWGDISWIPVAAFLAALVTVTCIALIQIAGAPRLQPVVRLFWILIVVFLAPVGVPLWFAYGLPASKPLKTKPAQNHSKA